jgi:hypothetical protein
VRSRQGRTTYQTGAGLPTIIRLLSLAVLLGPANAAVAEEIRGDDLAPPGHFKFEEHFGYTTTFDPKIGTSASQQAVFGESEFAYTGIEPLLFRFHDDGFERRFVRGQLVRAIGISVARQDEGDDVRVPLSAKAAGTADRHLAVREREQCGDRLVAPTLQEQLARKLRRIAIPLEHTAMACSA